MYHFLFVLSSIAKLRFERGALTLQLMIEDRVFLCYTMIVKLTPRFANIIYSYRFDFYANAIYAVVMPFCGFIIAKRHCRIFSQEFFHRGIKEAHLEVIRGV